MNSTLIKDLRRQAEDAWTKHFNFCSEQNVWKILDASLYDINLVGMSWKLRWIEEQLDKMAEKDLSNDWPNDSSHI